MLISMKNLKKVQEDRIGLLASGLFSPYNERKYLENMAACISGIKITFVWTMEALFSEHMTVRSRTAITSRVKSTSSFT